MTTRLKMSRCVAALLIIAGSDVVFAAKDDLPPIAGTAVVQIHAAQPSPALRGTQILGTAKASSRIVAVGDHGIVMLSDDNGGSFRQARSVPVDTTLTAVAFVDRDNGWAVGHGGVVIHTSDGGEHWTLQRKDLSVDQPLWGVYFKDRQNGWAVGLWSLMLQTKDGGASWQTVKAPVPPGAKKADRNFFSVFGDGKDGIYISCEQGLVLRSADSGQTWSYVETGYQGSFWTGLALPDGTLLVGGLRGNVYRSDDHGANWTHSATDFSNSITGFSAGSHGVVFASALDGVVLESGDDGRTFHGQQRAGRESLTAVTVSASGKTVLFSQSGVLN
ncbi:YCF48-related protein [Burkholderia sp. Bp8998]|uniref:WD40/YVTN/BNR-like repeat-containing protein n=1 Tax=Burkholderia sp. Bp8998 TaxID=2184557 RepID=UPI000F5AA919|nr:YCF48-related protein [Burkholderia sp. Bp8998]RQS06735.1 glycosyl hydrolase [Burkholderia sp. Bp8998]